MDQLVSNIRESRRNYSINIIIVFVVLSLFITNGMILLMGGIVLSIMVGVLWQPYSPPILMYFYFYQWLQIFAALIYAASDNYDINDQISDLYGSEKLIFITFIHLLVMVLVTNESLIKLKITYSELKSAAAKFDFKKILILYGIFSILFPSLLTLSASNASLNQLMQTFGIFRIILIILMIFLLFLSDKVNKKLIILILFGEFILSFVSYFSSFKDILVYIFLVYLTVKPSISVKQILKLSPLVLVTVIIVFFWSYVKGDYRAYLNQSSGQQVISVNNEDALTYLFQTAKEMDSESLEIGKDKFLKRVQYMEHYTTVYNRVPEIIPHTHGSNLVSTFLFLTTPRFLNPDKAVLDPSSKTTFYTGKLFANAAQGTSISMGYFADLYIEFGLLGMTLALIIIALIVAKASSFILNLKKYNLLFNYALLIAVILSIGTFESDITFFIGMMRNYIVMFIISNKYFFPKIYKYITH